MSFFSLSHVCTMFENNYQRLLVILSRNLERNFGWYIYPTFTFGKWTPLKVHFMILSLSESPRGQDFVPKHLNMILELILNSWQIVSHSYRDMCKFVKIRFETYVPAASTLRYDWCSISKNNLKDMHLILFWLKRAAKTWFQLFAN